MKILATFLLVFLLATPSLGEKISLKLETDPASGRVSASWASLFDTGNFILYYAPWPTGEPIKNVSLGPIRELTVFLPLGSYYYVAIGAFDSRGDFYLSNIEYFRLTEIYQPPPGISWQWQLSGPLNLEVSAELFDVDLFETPREIISILKSRGKKVICYFNAGAFEPWRPDASSFPEEILGFPLEDWPEERWLDIRRLDILAPLMEARLDLAARKGCDGVEPDNIDGYLHDTGFNLNLEDQLRYNIWLAKEAHLRGLSIGLKNNPEIACELEPYFDWALSEECFSYQECEKFLCFIKAHKAVLVAEYELDPENFCDKARRFGFSAIKKHPELDAFRLTCEEGYFARP